MKRNWELSQAIQKICTNSEEVLNTLEGIIGVLEQKNKLLN